MRNYMHNEIVKMSFEFALGIIEFAEILREERRYAFADQEIQSGCLKHNQHISTSAHR